MAAGAKWPLTDATELPEGSSSSTRTPPPVRRLHPDLVDFTRWPKGCQLKMPSNVTIKMEVW